jgi:agmatine/peptidylarginine deiminase
MRHFPAEFEKQSFIQVIFPHAGSDWADYLEEAEKNFIDIITAIADFQSCLVVCDDKAYVQAKFQANENIHFVQVRTNDTWARDCSALSVYDDGEARLLDFTFTGWGGKFDARLDNAMSRELAALYDAPMQSIDLILEGGAVESNAKGTLLTTSECVFNPNRNPHLTREQSIALFKEHFGVSKVLCLENGYLAGDDTDSHVDTLARFADENTIVYLKCEDEKDEHYSALKAMEEELKSFTDQDGKPFNLVSLPFTKAIYDADERLPATYANFLILNEAVLLPVYNDPSDEKAAEVLAGVFPTRRIVPVDCSTLIRQHGSLHCVTMQFPEKVRLNLF